MDYAELLFAYHVKQEALNNVNAKHPNAQGEEQQYYLRKEIGEIVGASVVVAKHIRTLVNE